MASCLPLLSRRLPARQVKPLGSAIRRLICPCTLACREKLAASRRHRNAQLRRWQSTTADPRIELERLLLDLQDTASDLINTLRLQLALRGLREAPGQEVIRVAVSGLITREIASHTAARLLRLLLADPLAEEAAWERKLAEHDPREELIIRVAPYTREPGGVEIVRKSDERNLHISSPELNSLNLEFVLLSTSLPVAAAEQQVDLSHLEDVVLVPAADKSSTDAEPSIFVTPVHRSILVGDGLAGAVSLAPQPINRAGNTILALVQWPDLSAEQLGANFSLVDVSLAEQALQLMRQGPQNAKPFEQLTIASHLPAVKQWLKRGASMAERAMKPALRGHIASLLSSTSSSICDAQERIRSRKKLSPPQDSHAGLRGLPDDIATWAQRAHAELQQQLDLAYAGRRWRKLGWWKLFWRVDDVAMLTTEMLAQRFLPTAEQELIYLAGRADAAASHLLHYAQPRSRADSTAKPESHSYLHDSDEQAPYHIGGASSAQSPTWPRHIAFTRRYLQTQTVPALQSLTQKLVLQSLGTSGVVTSLAALLYTSQFATTLYEAGAVAALGVVYSLGRMQKRWEAARKFWAGEVREEGRKAIRAAQESMSSAVEGSTDQQGRERDAERLLRTQELIGRAQAILDRVP